MAITKPISITSRNWPAARPQSCSNRARSTRRNPAGTLAEQRALRDAGRASSQQLRTEPGLNGLHQQARSTRSPPTRPFSSAISIPSRPCAKHHPAELIRSARRAGSQSWSAACSTGQEPYSLRHAAARTFPRTGQAGKYHPGHRPSPDRLRRRRAGSYSQFEVNRGLPAPISSNTSPSRATRWHVKAGDQAIRSSSAP